MDLKVTSYGSGDRVLVKIEDGAAQIRFRRYEIPELIEKLLPTLEPEQLRKIRHLVAHFEPKESAE
jgi:hypothetical protein